MVYGLNYWQHCQTECETQIIFSTNSLAVFSALDVFTSVFIHSEGKINVNLTFPR